MIIDGATIYNEGVGIGHDCEEKIRQIMTTLKAFSSSSNVSMRFLKTGRQYEALVWGNADDLPIGVYNCGPSLAHVLDTIYNKVKKQCFKAWKASRQVMAG
jgi:hypothetical protein